MAEETKKPAASAEKAESAGKSTEKTVKAPAGEKSDKPTGKPSKGKKGKAKRRTVLEGKVYIQATYNNTIVTITDMNGEVLAWSSAGSNGFKGAKKATPYAAQVSSENAANKAKVYGLEKVHVIVKGVGSGREQSIRGINIAGLSIESLTDITAIAHNGVRKRRARRV